MSFVIERPSETGALPEWIQELAPCRPEGKGRRTFNDRYHQRPANVHGITYIGFGKARGVVFPAELKNLTLTLYAGRAHLVHSDQALSDGREITVQTNPWAIHPVEGTGVMVQSYGCWLGWRFSLDQPLENEFVAPPGDFQIYSTPMVEDLVCVRTEADNTKRGHYHLGAFDLAKNPEYVVAFTGNNQQQLIVQTELYGVRTENTYFVHLRPEHFGFQPEQAHLLRFQGPGNIYVVERRCSPMNMANFEKDTVCVDFP